MTAQPENGTQRRFGDKECIYYDGYWIRYYPPQEESLAYRKHLIDSLTRRAFRHTEAGINTPGQRLEAARQAYEAETDPARKRVNGAMLAGALFNRATDLFTAIVELEHKGVRISGENELMQQCSDCFKQALELGKQVRHYSGQEGIDELWGEPFKAFTQPVANLFDSRYRKIAQTMRAIDNVTARLIQTFQCEPTFEGVIQRLERLASSAKLQIETMKSDDNFFSVWPDLVAALEALEGFQPKWIPEDDSETLQHNEQGVKLINAGTALITYLSEARVPMPKSTRNLLQLCESFSQERKDRRTDEKYGR